MPMKEENIRKYAELMAELGLTALQIEEDGVSLRLERGVMTSAPIPITAAPVHPVSAEAPVPAAAPANDGSITVTSPMVGVVSQAPAENAEPYVKVGDEVKQGQVLCIIEAMKMMNEITAEVDGVIVEVCAQNAQVVDYGYPLFRIKR